MNRRDTILIADNAEMNRAVLRSIFEEDYKVLEAENGEQALFLMRQYSSKIAAVLLDLAMPVMDGFAVLEERRGSWELRDLPVAVITGQDSMESGLRALDQAPGACELILKPFEPRLVHLRVQRMAEANLRREDQQILIQEQAVRLRESHSTMIAALSSIIEYRSAETGQHIKRIQMFTKVLLEDVAASCPEFGLDKSRIAMIAGASSLHDIGKIAIPDAILNKPGRLTEAEFEIMKTHAAKGCEMLEHLGPMGDHEYLEIAENICRCHHERWDGSGYPSGLVGDQIPVCAQVVGVADCYDALTTDRVYKNAIPPGQAFNMILNGECGAFGPKILESFKNVKEAFEELSRQYSDGAKVPSVEREEMLPQRMHKERTPDTLELGQMKYLTLLRQMDATVMEVDFKTGLYHLVYMADSDFELLRSGSLLEESISNFSQKAVHPGDRAAVLGFIKDGLREFFEKGSMKKSMSCRVKHNATGRYRRCSITVLKIYTGYPGHQRVIMVWKAESPGVSFGRGYKGVSEAASVQGFIGGMLQCCNDSNMTIVQVNGDFKQLLGYSGLQVCDRFQNQYANIICPADRAEALRQLGSQLKTGRQAEVEYRVIAESGAILWVLDKCRLSDNGDGDEIQTHMLIDVTQSRQAQDELRLTLERHRLILEQTNDVIFEWDIQKDTLSISSNWQEKFGFAPAQQNISRHIARASHLHPEDQPECLRLACRLSENAVYEEREIRIADSSGRYRWCRIRLAAQVDGMGIPFKVVGVLADIDDERGRSKYLNNQAERDILTGFYNRETGREKVEEYLRGICPEKGGAMFLVDVDDFKQVNDRYGHTFGDAVLQEISAQLRSQCLDSDMIVRIGGDEFLIFSPDISCREEAMGRGSQMMEVFERLCRQNIIKFRFSCSIGVSLCPAHGTDFDILYTKGRQALFQAKEQGKKRCCLYETADDLPSRKTGLASNTRIESDESPEGMEGELAAGTFEILSRSKNKRQAVEDVLELVGRRVGVSRASVAKLSADGNLLTTAYEWCNEGVRPQKEQVKDIPILDENGAYWKHFSKEGLFYCPDVSAMTGEYCKIIEKSGARSTLQSLLKTDGKIWGVMGVDDCFGGRVWTRQQVRALTLTARMVSVFLSGPDVPA